MSELRKQDKTAKRDGQYNFDVSNHDRESLTVSVPGEIGSATVQIFVVVAGGEMPVPEGGPWNDETLDGEGKPLRDGFANKIRTVTLQGRYDLVRVKVTGSQGDTNLKIGVR